MISSIPCSESLNCMRANDPLIRCCDWLVIRTQFYDDFQLIILIMICLIDRMWSKENQTSWQLKIDYSHLGMTVDCSKMVSRITSRSEWILLDNHYNLVFDYCRMVSCGNSRSQCILSDKQQNLMSVSCRMKSRANWSSWPLMIDNYHNWMVISCSLTASVNSRSQWILFETS